MDNVSPRRRSEIMGRVRGKDTGPEMEVRRMVFAMGRRYRLHAKDLPGRPDLVFRKDRKVILVHGCFWHGHSRCERARIPSTNQSYWSKKLERNSERDQSAASSLRRQGWRVLTVWECQMRDPRKVERRLRGFLDA